MKLTRDDIIKAIKGPDYVEVCHCGEPFDKHYSEHCAVPMEDPDIGMAADRVMALISSPPEPAYVERWFDSATDCPK
jgi:hypothetical protein